MKLLRTLSTVCALTALASPAAASAQVQAPPPAGDAYRNPIILSNATSPLELSPSIVGFDADTTNYTTEDSDSIFEGGGEYNICGPPGRESAYGKTVWSVFYTNRTGRIDITAAGFDAVIGLHRFRSPADIRPIPGSCTDRIAGRIESFPREGLPTVAKNSWYAVQVGGYRNPADGSIAGGPLEVAIELLPPERVQGDAILTWRSVSGGIKVTSVKVDGPNGSVAGISCLRKKCGRQQIVQNPKPAGVFARALAKVDPSAKSAGGKYKPAARNDAPVRMSAKSVFKGRTIKNGARLLVLIFAQDQIGQAFYWDVKNNAAGTKTLGCVEPGGTRVQRTGTCDGR
jgi:hypothetical protein